VRAVLAVAAAAAVFGLAVANGHPWELVWLPAVVLGAVWPYESNGGIRSCLRRLGRRGESQA
jgi:hypothetical protein